MLFEPTTLAATATAIAAVVESYGCDSRVVFQRAGLDMDEMQRPGARYPFRAMTRLWNEAESATGDPCIGLLAAQRLKPQALHALGLSWLASRTLLEGLNRMVRYARIANTSLKLELEETREQQFKLVSGIQATQLEPAPAAIDAIPAFVVKMCRLNTDANFAPRLVTFEHEDHGHADTYVGHFRAPVLFGKTENALYFDSKGLKQLVPGGNSELAEEVDQIAERYLATLDPNRVQDQVRELLLRLLPSGEVDQNTVANSLNRSVSSLQRQLRAEGSSYRRVLDDTREGMAVGLVRERRYSLAQIAYLLGFADQANFTRAFKRWTGATPSEFRQN
jgi:AraC-like DNA-binding protein